MLRTQFENASTHRFCFRIFGFCGWRTTISGNSEISSPINFFCYSLQIDFVNISTLLSGVYGKYKVLGYQLTRLVMEFWLKNCPWPEILRTINIHNNNWKHCNCCYRNDWRPKIENIQIHWIICFSLKMLHQNLCYNWNLKFSHQMFSHFIAAILHNSSRQ